MDILSYVMGQKSAGSGGGSDGGVIFTEPRYQTGSEYEVELDMTAGEIRDAIGEGKTVIIRDTQGLLLTSVSIGIEEGDIAYATIISIAIPKSSGGILAYVDGISLSDLVFYDEDTYPHPYYD